ncbi:unnamed protein product, partial [Polarella glacialis]
FKAVLENNIDSIGDSTGQVDTILQAIVPGNVALLKTSNVVVGQLVDAAKAAGSVAPGLVVAIAGRQRMLIQRMCKEALLVGLGFDATANLANLKSTSSLFGASHSGVIMGAEWASLVVCCLLFVIRCLLFVICRSLFVVCCLLFVVVRCVSSWAPSGPVPIIFSFFDSHCQ